MWSHWLLTLLFVIETWNQFVSQWDMQIEGYLHEEWGDFVLGQCGDLHLPTACAKSANTAQDKAVHKHLILHRVKTRLVLSQPITLQNYSAKLTVQIKEWYNAGFTIVSSTITLLSLNCCLLSISDVANMLCVISDFQCLTGHCCRLVGNWFIKLWSLMHAYSIKFPYKFDWKKLHKTYIFHIILVCALLLLHSVYIKNKFVK